MAPVAGRVGLRKVDAGNYVTTADVIALVTQIDPITVIFGVPEDYIPDIMRAQKKSGGLKVAAFDRSDTKQIATGRLLTLDNSIDSTTGMVSGRAEFENKEETLYPNQFVNVHLLVDVREKTIAAPKAAIRTGASGPFVYKVTDDSRVVMQSVGARGRRAFRRLRRIQRWHDRDRQRPRRRRSRRRRRSGQIARRRLRSTRGERRPGVGGAAFRNAPQGPEPGAAAGAASAPTDDAAVSAPTITRSTKAL